MPAKAARRPCRLVVALAGRPRRRTGVHRLDFARNRRAGDEKKSELKPWKREQFCIPPEANAEFVCAMEDVLEVYARPLDKRRPLVCMDEASKQLLRETRLPIGGAPERFDYEYVRNGTANIFMFFEPLAARRHVEVTERRTRVDWAKQIKKLCDEIHPEAEKIVLVMDNLNTHAGASATARRLPGKRRRGKNATINTPVRSIGGLPPKTLESNSNDSAYNPPDVPVYVQARVFESLNACTIYWRCAMPRILPGGPKPGHSAIQPHPGDHI